MADEAREYLRAAQQAEMRGDKAQAVELLAKAAAVYRSRGQNARALQMMRHASRLDGTRTDISDEVRRMEWMPDRPFLRAVSEAEEEAEELNALKPLEDLALKPAAEDDFSSAEEKQLIERGPTLADPALNAWCSFCCRPKNEVGELVAGPAGAYVCLACVRESAKLLGATLDLAAAVAASSGGQSISSSVAPLPPAPPPVIAPAPPAPIAVPEVAEVAARPPPPTVDPVGQGSAVAAIETALRLGVGSVLVLGPEGSGKTAHLRELERKGLGVYVDSPRGFEGAPADLPVFIDHGDRATPEEWRAIGKALRAGRSAPVVIALHGVLPEPEVMLARDGEELPLYPTSALANATQGRVPPEVLERLQIAVAFQPPSRDELTEIARRLAALRASELDPSDDLLGTLADLALASGRLGHELRALLGRLPAGEWTSRRVAAKAEPEKKSSRRRKKTDES